MSRGLGYSKSAADKSITGRCPKVLHCCHAAVVRLTQLEEALQPLKPRSTTREKVTAKARTSAKEDPDAAAERAGRCYDACRAMVELKEISDPGAIRTTFTEVAECVRLCADAAGLPPPTQKELLKVIDTKWRAFAYSWKLAGLYKLMFQAGEGSRAL